MKHLTVNKLLLLWFITSVGLIVYGCGLLPKPTTPPSATERYLFDVKTNVVTVTNIVPTTPLTSTNTVFLTNTVTGAVLQSNVISVVQQYLTNSGLQTNYALTPNQNGPATAGTVGSIFGMGGIASLAANLLLGLYATVRNRRANAVQASLAQAVETAKSILLNTPQGQQLANNFTTWMMAHQADAGVIQAVSALVDQAVDPSKATQVAQQLITMSGGSLTASKPLTPTNIV